MDLNKVFIVGRLTADPELRTTAGGQSVTTFGVATNRTWTDKAGARQTEVEYHSVVAWGRSAEIASQFLKKGGMVLVEGRIRTRSWQDKQGQNRKTTEIIAERLQLGPRSAGQGGGRQEEVSAGGPAAGKSAEPEMPTIDLDDDLGGNSERSRGVDETGGGEAKSEDLPF